MVPLQGALVSKRPEGPGLAEMPPERQSARAGLYQDQDVQLVAFCRLSSGFSAEFREYLTHINVLAISLEVDQLKGDVNEFVWNELSE